MTYEIFEGNMERLEKKLTRIENKCKKFGCDFTYEKIGETYRELENEDGIKYMARFIQIETAGHAVMNDWELVASVDHTEKGNIFNRVSAIEIPERYYTCKPVCEHCNSKRSRKNTYIVRNLKTNEFKQVGRSCLNDFTHGLSAEAAASYISLHETLIEGETPWASSYGEKYYEKNDMLLFIVETIRKFGFVKRSYDSYETSTADRASTYHMVYHGYGHLFKEVIESAKEEMTKVNFEPYTEKNEELVKSALAWIAEQDETNNYMHNLKTACSLEYVTAKHFGILASLFPSYNRELAWQAKKEKEKVSEYVGNIKDRINLTIKSFTCLTGWETQFGMTFIYKIVGEDGNTYTWKTSKSLDDEWMIGKTLTGTVKDHREYRGVKQTELTRCKVA